MAGYKRDASGPNSEDKALDLFAEMMIEKIEGLQNDWSKPWFTEGTLRWPRNLTGRNYNGMNALMLMMHCEKNGYTIPRFCTFDCIQHFNKGGESKNAEKLPVVSILKGEKSFPVMLTTFTCVDKKTKEKIKYDDYKRLSDEEKSHYNVYPKLQVFSFFYVAQTNLQEARPELWNKLVQKESVQARENKDTFRFEPVDKMIKYNLWICPIKPQYQDSAYYSISKDEIVVPEMKQFKNSEAFYGTLFHEMTHSTGAKQHLDRFNPSSGFGSPEYAYEELVAELGSALVSQRYGMTKNIKEDSCAYLKSWLPQLKESPQFLKSTLLDVKKATSLITQQVDQISIELNELESISTEQKQEMNEEVKTKLDKFMTDYYWAARRDNGFRMQGFIEFEGKPALRLANESSNGSSLYLVTHEQDIENRDHYYLRLMDGNKKIFKSRELPHDCDEAYSFLRGAAKEQLDYEYENSPENQVEKSETENQHSGMRR